MAKCQEQALFRYTWAGRNESFCCLTHAQQIQGVAQAMSYYVQLIPLSGDEQLKVTCQNEVRANTASSGLAPSAPEPDPLGMDIDEPWTESP